ncbi:extracellular calcium-sensing receptor-like [Xenopus tropicalis]|uniref:Extracellular calcium-sensing receptor-like n=1 Tax=Xenopus tropicalis TaxID=8364 RepID=A0A8J1J8G8_XENTR|nr:extracellular calcium-sensing receptor-like [Xenopus tropicalis]
MQALIFAVEEINSDPELLPNITLGFQTFDTCNNVRGAAQGTLLMLSGGNEIVPNYNCHLGAPLVGIIGESGSTRSILMAQILGLYRYPQISYFASSPILSDRNLFSSFFRTIPSDEFQMRGLAQLVSHFGWTWLLHHIKNVNFSIKDGSHVFFDAKGNPPVIYDIVNWRLRAKGTLEQAVIGNYSYLNSLDGKILNIDGAQMTWNNGDTQVPLSKCSPSCPSGFRKVIVPGKPPFCYECARCPQGQISNQTDAVECQLCSWDMWPNLQQDRCLPRPTEFLSYGDPLGYSLAAISIFSSSIPLNILGVFIHFKKTPIVRANNYSLSCLLLLSLFLCFLCSLGFIGYPQPEKCLLRQVAFGMVFALCISCVLAKTITVVIAFNATKPGSRLRKWTGVKVSYCVIGFCIFIQLFVCVIWLIFFPPVPEHDTDTKPGVIIVNCNEGSPTAFWCMLGYLGLLASISFIVAFLARRLPDSFNEAKLITFSMLAFLSVWVSFIPAYLSARGMYTVAMEVFAILSSSWAVVGCIFVPKCYIILFRPNMNSREHFKISYFATNPILSDRNLFPSFFRTIPSDEFQMRGLAQLISYFGWTWVGLVANDNDYGQYGLQILMQEIINGGGCVAFAEKILTGRPNMNAPYLAHVIKMSNVKVVVMITSNTYFVELMEEMLRQNVTGITWIVSEALSTSNLLSKESIKSIVLGTVGFAIHRGKIPQFTEHLRSLSPSKNLNDLFLREYWEQIFSCKGVTFQPISVIDFIDYTDNTSAVCGLTFQLLHYVNNVRFKTTDGSQVFFDAKGNPPPIYDIVSWRPSTKGTLEPAMVGFYDLNSPDGDTLTIDTTGITWNSNTQV